MDSLQEAYRRGGCKTYPSSQESLDIPENPPELFKKKKEVITICKIFLEKQNSYRGDYKELASLTLLYLNDSKTKASFEKFLKPGAMHSARWMAKLIYSFKVVLLGSTTSDLPKGTVCSISQMKKLKRFVEAEPGRFDPKPFRPNTFRPNQT